MKLPMLFSTLLRIERQLMSLIFPKRALCLSCGRLSQGDPLCPVCTQEMTTLLLHGDLCPLCGHALVSSPCDFCRGEAPARMRSAWRHAGAPRQLVLRLKYGCIAEAAALLIPAMADCARKLDCPPGTVVTWVTMPRSRRRARGIDHGRILAEHLARQLNLPCRRLLAREDKGRTQHSLGRRQRQRNLQGLFSCEEQLAFPVLLVDDVMTTSATARVCAEALLQAGATQVMVVTATQA